MGEVTDSHRTCTIAIRRTEEQRVGVSVWGVPLANVSGFLGITEMRFHDFGVPFHGQNDGLLFQSGR